MRKQNKKIKQDKALRKQKQEERSELVRKNKKILFNMIEDADKILKDDRIISSNDFITTNEKYYKDDIRLVNIFAFIKSNYGAIFKKIFEYKKSKLGYKEDFKAEINTKEIAITAISMYIIYGIITGINYNISTKKLYALSKDKNFKELVLNINIDKLIKKYSNS